MVDERETQEEVPNRIVGTRDSQGLLDNETEREVTVVDLGMRDAPDDFSSGDDSGDSVDASDDLGSDSTTLAGELDVDVARGGLVAARGTVDGLVIRVDGRLESGAMRQALDEFVSARSSFLAGQEVFLEWVGVRPATDVEESLTQLLTKSYGIIVKSVRLFSRSSEKIGRAGLSGSGGRAPVGGPSSIPSGAESSYGRRGGEGLFGGVRSIESEQTRGSGSTLGRGVGSAAAAFAATPAGRSSGHSRTFQSPLSGNVVPWDEPDSRLVHATLRSGQRLESEHSLVIVGDVNSGAEVVSGGDIVILGTLRGVAHAGAYEESGGGRVIFSLNMQPTQLRIGGVISRGGSVETRSGESRTQDGRVCPEVARVDGSLIVVEPYQTKTLGKSVSGLASTVGLLGRRRGSA